MIKDNQYFTRWTAKFLSLAYISPIIIIIQTFNLVNILNVRFKTENRK